MINYKMNVHKERIIEILHCYCDNAYNLPEVTTVSQKHYDELVSEAELGYGVEPFTATGLYLGSTKLKVKK